MVDKAHAAASGDTKDAANPGTPVKRSMHRHTDPRDAVAEMAARAQEISQEAGSRIGKAMKDMIGAAAGLAGFAVESARDLAQYMVRRGQMTQEEADKLIREAEEAYRKGRRSSSRGSGGGTGRAPRATKPAAKSEGKNAAARKKTARKSTTAPKKKTAAAKKSAAKSKTGKAAASSRAASKKKPATTARARSKSAKKKK